MSPIVIYAEKMILWVINKATNQGPPKRNKKFFLI